MSKTSNRKFSPRYVPTRTFTHPVMGRVDCYNLAREPICDGSGAQAMFYDNNARPNRKREYGIKLFNTASEAFAAYQRQKIAADAGLAPPVRRMVCFVAPGLRYSPSADRWVRVPQKVRWGYQTSLAYGIGKLEVGMAAEEMQEPDFIPESGVRNLYRAILRLSTKGTQSDFKRLGTPRRANARMSNDLHQENLGFWRKRPVVIDFGSHLVGEVA
jgi:hypothetical protein